VLTRGLHGDRVSRCPFATWNPILGKPGITYVEGARKRGVLHSTQGGYDYVPRADGSYLGVWTPPQITVARNGVFQHIDTDWASYAAVNLGGGVETNRYGCVQIEVCGMAQDAPDWPEDLYANLVRTMRWVEQEHGIRPAYIDEGHIVWDDWLWPDGRTRYPVGSEPWRISMTEWAAVDCWVGHCHVPENEHADPGKVRLDLLFPKAKPPVQEDDMPRYSFPPSWSQIHQDGPFVGQRPVVVVDEQTGRLLGRSGCTFEPRDLSIMDGSGEYVVDVSNGPLKGGQVISTFRGDGDGGGDRDTVTFVTEGGQYALRAVAP
jgi:hypothetical protein